MLKDLPVNLGDPRDIHEKMPKIRHLLVEAREAQATLTDQLAAQTEQVKLLERIVGKPGAVSGAHAKAKEKAKDRKTEKPSGAQKAAPSQEQAARALERAGHPMGPAELFRFMESEGMEMPTSVGALNARLWAASKTGRVVKRSDNTYAPAGGFPAASNGHAQLPGLPSGSPTADTQTSPNGDGRRGGDQEQGLRLGDRQPAGHS
jgi:hypothetical protein